MTSDAASLSSTVRFPWHPWLIMHYSRLPAIHNDESLYIRLSIFFHQPEPDRWARFFYSILIRHWSDWVRLNSNFVYYFWVGSYWVRLDCVGWGWVGSGFMSNKRPVASLIFIVLQISVGVRPTYILVGSSWIFFSGGSDGPSAKWSSLFVLGAGAASRLVEHKIKDTKQRHQNLSCLQSLLYQRWREKRKKEDFLIDLCHGWWVLSEMNMIASNWSKHQGGSAQTLLQ